MRCFYHSADLDGHCAGAVVRMYRPDVQCIGINYGQPFPWHEVEGVWPRQPLFVVDFSLQPFSDMVRLAGTCDLVWIDHHVTAIEEATKHKEDFNPGGKREVGKAGCELTYEYFNAHAALHTPIAVRLIGRYDVWDHSDPRVIPFQYRVRCFPETRPETDEGMKTWRYLFGLGEGEVAVLVEQGKVVMEYVKGYNAKYVGAFAFETELDGMKLIAANVGMANSQVFDSVWDPDTYDAMCAFVMRRGGGWTVSLYTDKKGINVGLAAKNRGGGGHRQASGFQCDALPFHVPRGR